MVFKTLRANGGSIGAVVVAEWQYQVALPAGVPLIQAAQNVVFLAVIAGHQIASGPWCSAFWPGFIALRAALAGISARCGEGVKHCPCHRRGECPLRKCHGFVDPENLGEQAPTGPRNGWSIKKHADYGV